MNPLERRLSRLRNFNAWVSGTDPKLAEEAADTVNTEALELAASPEALAKAVQEESIALRRTRPVLAIKENVTQLVFIEQADSAIWKERLTSAAQALDPANPQLRVGDGIRSDSHGAGAAGMVRRDRGVPDPRIDLGVGLHLFSGRGLGAAIGRHWLLICHVAGALDAFAQARQVV